MRRTTAFVTLAAAILMGSTSGRAHTASFSSAAEAAALRVRGLEQGFNLDHAQALDTFKASIAADPDHPAGYRLVAATAWLMLLFEQGNISVDDYFGELRAYGPQTKSNHPLEAMFREYISQATSIAEERLARAPRDADAHFQVGAAYGFQASFAATLQGRIVGSLGPARRAYAENERVLALDPNRKEAGVSLGMYRYAVAGLPAPLRWLAHLAGFAGDRAKAIELVEAAARQPHESQANAMFTLILMYNGEGRHLDALHLLAELERRYPKNRLLWLEEANTWLRAGRPQNAKAALDIGLAKLAADPRPRALGEESRWRYAEGAALVGVRDTAGAGRALNAALPLSARDWVRGRVHAELGKLADLAGERPRAISEYRQAARLCGNDKDEECVADARRLMKAVYR
jgi:tetratricopeptide (TPR) repeat protein